MADGATASSARVSRRMSRQRTRNTGPEMEIRRHLHRKGLRFRLHCRPEAGVRRAADVVFRPSKVAVFVDGCFWHCCPVHGTMPRANGEWWAAKLAANQARDAGTTAKLTELGWEVIRVWEHEAPAEAAERIAEVVRARRPARRQRSVVAQP